MQEIENEAPRAKARGLSERNTERPKTHPQSEECGFWPRMYKRADLHIHTTYSDGTFSPQEVVKYAKEKGLLTIAITDHDCVDGIAAALSAAKAQGIEVIPGIEITSEISGHEVHMLGYFINHNDKNLINELKDLSRLRKLRMARMLECLSKADIEVSLEDVKNIGGEGSLGRLHLAKVLLNKGYVKSIKEAFDKYLGNGKPCYAQGDKVSPSKAISMITLASGVAVLAHPYTIGNDELIPILVESGLKGIEVYHSDHSVPVAKHYAEIAKKFNLLVTGGSDCHGAGKDRVMMGNIWVPYEIVEKLKSASRSA